MSHPKWKLIFAKVCPIQNIPSFLLCLFCSVSERFDFWDPEMIKCGSSSNIISISRTSNRVRSSIKKSSNTMELKYHCCEFAEDLQKFQNLRTHCRDRLKDLGVTINRTRSKSLQSLLVFSRSLNKKSSRYVQWPEFRRKAGNFYWGINPAGLIDAGNILGNMWEIGCIFLQEMKK